MQTKEVSKTNRIFVAFPGLGKTTYAQQHANVVDLDFGNLRSAFDLKRPSEIASLRIPFQKLAKYYFQDGFNVLTNEPSMIPLLVQIAPRDRITVVIPKDLASHVDRVRERAQKSKRHKPEFANDMAKNISDWVEDWSQMAENYRLKLIKVVNFEEAV